MLLSLFVVKIHLKNEKKNICEQLGAWGMQSRLIVIYPHNYRFLKILSSCYNQDIHYKLSCYFCVKM